MRHFVLASLLTFSGIAAQEEENSYRDRDLRTAEQLAADGKTEAARKSVLRALERDDRSLTALLLLSRLSTALEDQDTAVHAMHRWLDLVQSHKKSPISQKDRRTIVEELVAMDPEAKQWDLLQRRYVNDLVELAKEYKRKEDWLATLEVYNHILDVDPHHTVAQNGIREVRRKGGAEVAVEDVFAGADPTLGKSPEEIRRDDERHAAWQTAWTKSTDNYRYRTNAGFLVLETAAIAMEQMNRFYRKFFRYKTEGGKTPKIEVRIFKSRNEYLELGSSPAEWSGGQFTGSAVETYVGGITGKDSIRGMYRTLFHEAAHQFVRLAIAFVPGWLNEAYASFFEGCTILSNGSVKWNQAPPGRLFPLADRLANGWMADKDDGVRDDTGEWSTPHKAPTMEIIVNGDYEWGPPWYAPTWGFVYFLYNYRTEDGQPIYRDALHAYALSFRRGRPKDPHLHFEEIVLLGSPLSPVKKIGEVNEIWRKWILDLRDRHTGKVEVGNELERFGDAAVQREDLNAAIEFYEDALADRPGNPELLEKLLKLHERLKNRAKAAAICRQLKRELEIRGRMEEELYQDVARRTFQLDPIARRYQDLKKRVAVDGLELARSYEQRDLPTMALEIARRMSGRFSSPEALEYYAEVARRTGVSLARWKLAYNGVSLKGWSGATESYRPYSEEILADVPDEASEAGVFTQELVCDVTFDADFSLEAEMLLEGDGDGGHLGSWMGLCWGRKTAGTFHAVLLHPKGFMDISSNNGGVWSVRDHRNCAVGNEWRKLRIDVTGRKLDVYLDGLYVRELEFGSTETMRGAFGLITGAGQAHYRNIRVLARDAFDPAALIERRLAMERISENSALRQAGVFAGRIPPPIRVKTWVQGEPTTLEALRGQPVVLSFWSPNQDRVIPTAEYLSHLAERGESSGYEVLVICDAGTPEDELRSYLAEHPIRGAHVGIDDPNHTYDGYFVKEGFHGIPRLLIIDRDGKVLFEGDPGLSSGSGWSPGMKTYADASFERLLDADDDSDDGETPSPETPETPDKETERQ